MKIYLAIDLGASSGRHIAGWKENGEIRTEEIYRFPNGAEEKDGHLTWNVRSLFDHIKAGLKTAFAKYGAIESVAIDTWGVDYVLMDGDKEIFPCYAYRDGRTAAVAEEVLSLIHI